MSERITADNLDEVIKRNEVIEEQMKQSASLIWSKYNPMQINSPIQLALQILRPYGLIQLPMNTSQTRSNQGNQHTKTTAIASKFILQKTEVTHHSIPSINTPINPSSNPSSHPP